MNKAFLQISHLSKTYDGKSFILNDISMNVQKGEVVVILGPSGCGKSTFLRCLNGLERIQSGEIYFKGELISHKKTNWNAIRQRIGMVFQSYDLFPHMNVIENILLGPLKVQKRDKQAAQEQAENLLSRVGLLEKAHAYPRALSGGQKQRVAIVRALCMNPEIMLFDEVTASLDPEMVKEVLEVILELAREGMTMLIVTHEMRFAQKVADRICFFDEGKLVEQSSPYEFFTHPKSQRAQRFLDIFNL
ncbi:amino acid ABC transporter ATP-binding protein [Helicobacter marmotae]|uniref:Probable ABC transporter ATP-binding protein PEB1C n=1 Tax=Helicobacter marmotae TaxID=152490 RepID=A0A3D8I5B9_9HELI|nr:amino acid ABC transporter ATP-binding protein [Helicobacter marmotae]RDU60185.1 amino acid ABC transporter ATP-binding protein [Helicobacter marmotae]